jgi:hypothetical protein
LLILTSISGSFAYLDPGVLDRDAESMAMFFQAMICGAQGDQLVLSTIRTIVESLLIYHLPAEIALESIEKTKKTEIEKRYKELIDMANNKPGTNIPGSCNGRYMGIKVDGVLNAVLEWTTDYIKEVRHPSVVNYVHQKLFVLVLQVYETAMQHEKFDISAPSKIQTQSRLLAARLMSKLDMKRLCVCEGIMLSVFLKRPFSGLFDRKLAEYIQRLNFQTMWDGFALAESTTTELTAYTKKIVDRNGVPSMNRNSSHGGHFYENFVKEIEEFLKIANDEGMEGSHQRQVLMWTQRVWDWLCDPDSPNERPFKSKVTDGLTEQMIQTDG